ncbi:EAL domain-containing protein [Schinkia azotoformans]|uniref:EAL domain-containing protein n=1 Tax=Schinkia azotoformans TaxID=1454 RepID=UPI002DBE7391|nr:EAL domain-containing protein [Schinkia azotoformans]MEC1759864.1 EAL domain-containing protein [Schinkia azotoformans]
MKTIDKDFLFEANLKKALENDEFRLHYQPKVNLVTGRIWAVEALIRWEHPKKGIIPPLEFIPFAEESGWIVPIGDWVLRTACQQLKDWLNEGFHPMVMAVNLSASQFYQPDFVKTVQSVIEETGIPPEYIEFEITESIMLNSESVLPVIRDLKQIGVRIGLDDFGTGFCSLYYLKEFPIDFIKIDQSFVQNCTTDSKDETIVKAIIAMSHQLKLEVIAEGIETKEQLIFLQQHLCNTGQGYFFSKPIPSQEFVQQFNEIERIVFQNGIPQEFNRQKWLEEELELSRQNLKDTIRKQQGMIFKFVKQNGKFIHTLCDGELLYQAGGTPEHVVGKELHDFLPEKDANNKLHYYERAWEVEENVIYEGKLGDIWYLASLRPIRRGGQVVEVIGSCVDITQRKVLEESLKLSEYKYRLIAENMQDLIGVLDTNGIIQYASPSHKTVLGFSPYVYEGNSAFEQVHPEDIAYIKKQYENMIKTKTSCYVEFRYRHDNGDWVDLEALGTPVLDKQGEVEHIVLVARDISKRKKAEELLLRSEKRSVLGRLAKGVAHEIRNPLTSIKGFVQLLQEEEIHTFYTDIIMAEIHRLEEIVEDFLFLAKTEDNQRKDVDSKNLLDEVVQLYKLKAILKNIEIVQEPVLDSPLINCDVNQMKHVFMNILQNSVEAMPEGGIITIKMFWKDSNHITFRFIDRGNGITEDRMKHIAEPFYSNKEKGTGLGLTICQKIIHEHGGTMVIKSKVNQGTIVDINLPTKQLYLIENN